METEEFRFTGRPVREGTIKTLWEEIRCELKTEHPVENIKMPRIEALRLSYSRFEKAMKKLKRSPHLTDQDGIELGVKATKAEKMKASACVFFSDVDQCWVILKCEGFYPLEVDLKHELLHIWEKILCLPWGTLAKKEER